MTAQSYCRNKSCRAVVAGNVTTCPTCGGTMAGARWIRSTGWVLTIAGTVIAAPMLFVVMRFLPVVADPAAAVAAGRFGGPSAMVMPSFILLLLVLAFGALMALFGLQRAIKGVRNPLAKPMILGFGILFFAMFFYVGSQLPDNQMVDGIPVADIR